MGLAGAKRQLNEKGPRLSSWAFFLAPALVRRARRSYLIREVKGEVTREHLIRAI